MIRQRFVPFSKDNPIYTYIHAGYIYRYEYIFFHIKNILFMDTGAHPKVIHGRKQYKILLPGLQIVIDLRVKGRWIVWKFNRHKLKRSTV